MGRGRQRTKTIEPFVRGDPDIAFAILEQPLDVVARETIGACESVGSPAMNVEQAAVMGSDPERTFPIAKEDRRRKLD
jgi:hypothetical protein